MKNISKTLELEVHAIIIMRLYMYCVYTTTVRRDALLKLLFFLHNILTAHNKPFEVSDPRFFFSLT